MIAEAWLVLELKADRYAPSRVKGIKIKKVMQSRPMEGLAVKIRLDIDPDQLQPTATVLVSESAISNVMVEELDEPVIRVRRGDGD